MKCSSPAVHVHALHVSLFSVGFLLQSKDMHLA